MTSISFEKGFENSPLKDRLKQGAKLAQAALENVARPLVFIDEPEKSIERQPSGGRPRFNVLDELHQKLQQANNHEAVMAELNDTAEQLLRQQKELDERTRRDNNVGLAAVWSALHAWDDVRSEPTEALVTHLLNEFWGEGQPALVAAFNQARDLQNKKHPVPFHQVLDEVNRDRAA